MTTTVVHFKDVKDHWDPKTQSWDDPRYQYIGRRNQRHNLPPSVYQNPYPMHRQTSSERERVINLYKAHLELRPHLVKQAKWELKDKILVCWCHPYACHGDVLAKIVNEDSYR